MKLSQALDFFPGTQGFRNLNHALLLSAFHYFVSGNSRSNGRPSSRPCSFRFRVGLFFFRAVAHFCGVPVSERTVLISGEVGAVMHAQELVLQRVLQVLGTRPFQPSRRRRRVKKFQ